MSDHNIIRPGEPNHIHAALAADQQARAAQAQIATFVHATAMAIYGPLVAGAVSRSPEALRTLAQRARNAAPFLAEAFGMLTVSVQAEAEAKTD